jgi:GT2 family glycosyltransferase
MKRPQPRCSVVIPVHNEASLTKQCLETILQAPPPSTPLEVIVVDDASTDSTQDIVRLFGSRVRSIQLPTNVGFASACNAGAAAAAVSSEFLLFLNNDTIPSGGWLDTLIRYADAHPEAAVVGSKLLFPDGTIQHAGVVFTLAGYPLHIYAGCPGDHPAVNRSRAFQAVTAACALVRRTDFENLQGFDPTYENDLEDIDLCLRLGQIGRQTHYCHESVVLHHESASRGRPTGPGRSARIYWERWGSRVRADEVSYYSEDGLLDVLRVQPDKLKLGRANREVADVLQARSRQLFALLRESVKASTFSAPHRLDEQHGVVRTSRRRDLSPLTARKRLERRLKTLREELSAALADLVDRVAFVDKSTAKASQDAPSSTAAGAYERVLRELPAFLARETEAGATILVVSKGDDRLLRVDGRSAWHFPRAADGRYAGYHPADSEEAVDHLERLRRHGADYIAFPQSSLWWLDYYSGLKRHLREYDVRRNDAIGAVFDLRNRRIEVEGEAPFGGVRLAERGAPELAMAPIVVAEPMQAVASIVGGLLPRNAKLSVMTTESEVHPALPAEQIAMIAVEDDEARVLTAVEENATAGSEFLIVPHHVFSWLNDRPSLAGELHARYRLVTRQEHFCEIYDLRHGSRQLVPSNQGG